MEDNIFFLDNFFYMKLGLVDPKSDLIILKSFYIHKKIKQLLNKSSKDIPV